jgi:hypothetical protein
MSQRKEWSCVAAAVATQRRTHEEASNAEKVHLIVE